MDLKKAHDLTKRKSKKVRAFLFILGIMIALHGTIGFMMFILEEGMQTSMFAAFSYRNAKDWQGLNDHVKIMESQQRFSEITIKYFGWPAILMWPAYLKYLEQNQAYINAIKSEVAVNLKGNTMNLNSKTLTGDATEKQITYLILLAKGKASEEKISKLSKQEASNCIEFFKEGTGSCVLVS